MSLPFLSQEAPPFLRFCELTVWFSPGTALIEDKCNLYASHLFAAVKTCKKRLKFDLLLCGDWTKWFKPLQQHLKDLLNLCIIFSCQFVIHQILINLWLIWFLIKMPAPNSFLPFYNYHKSIDGKMFLFNFTVSMAFPLNCPSKPYRHFCICSTIVGWNY